MAVGSVEYFTAGRFGQTFDFIRIPGVNTGNWPVVSETAYVWTIGALAVVTFCVGVIRIVLRRKFNGRWDLDDALFAFALCCSAISAIFNVYCVSYFYVEAELNIGSVTFADFHQVVPAVVQYLQILNSVSAVEWIAIYSVKLCYLMFFNKLTARLRGLRVWWWFVLCFTIPCLIVSCLIGLFLCHDFGPDILLQCTIPDMNMKGGTWNRISGSLDVATDLMIISIPIILISKVKIDTRRKIIICTILSLSAAMIATALIRLWPPTIRILTIDGPWYFFWVAFESSLAILMVSITSFKSIYGGVKRSTSPDKSPASPFSRLRQSFSNASSRMGRFFIWTSRSNESISSTSELSPMSTEKRIQQGRYFQWETQNTASATTAAYDDVEKGYGRHVSVAPRIRVEEQIRVDVSQLSDSTMISGPSYVLSPASTVNLPVSPVSAHTDRNTDTSWYGRYGN